MLLIWPAISNTLVSRSSVATLSSKAMRSISWRSTNAVCASLKFELADAVGMFTRSKLLHQRRSEGYAGPVNSFSPTMVITSSGSNAVLMWSVSSLNLR